VEASDALIAFDRQGSIVVLDGEVLAYRPRAISQKWMGMVQQGVLRQNDMKQVVEGFLIEQASRPL
jgi:hypothetical protein